MSSTPLRLFSAAGSGQGELLPRVPGTYILVLYADSPRTITVGKLGTITLAPGWVLYAGSAFGRGGLAGRIKHHLRPVTKPHWHIDYVRAALDLCAVWVCTAAQRMEHCFASTLQSAPGSSMPLPRCGASDCHCAAHLFHFAERPSVHLITDESSATLRIFHVH